MEPTFGVPEVLVIGVGLVDVVVVQIPRPLQVAQVGLEVLPVIPLGIVLVFEGLEPEAHLIDLFLCGNGEQWSNVIGRICDPNISKYVK